MLMFDKKKAISTVMQSRREKDGSVSGAPMVPSVMKDEGGEIDPRHEAAKDILSAVNEKHPGKLMEALAAFHDLHEMHSTAGMEQDTEE